MQDVCLFAHFDQDDKVDDYVLHYLGKIRELNFSIVFISTAKLTRADIERLRADCFDVILRDNTGYDFGSWANGFERYGASIQGRLLLANDSVYGPIGDFAAAFARMIATPADFYGLVESGEIAPHLQSWFLLFEPNVVRSSEFAAILAQPFAAMSKRQVIENGEVGLSRRLIAADFHYSALFTIDRAGLAARRFNMNPSHILWRELLLEEGIPFLKVELLRGRPAGIDGTEAILQAVEPSDPMLCTLIRNHLGRTTGTEASRHWYDAPLSRFRSMRYAMFRESYRLRRENRPTAEAWNLIKLWTTTTPVRIWHGLCRLAS